MCGLFGFLKYGGGRTNIQELTEALAAESASRGTDATGVAYNDRNKLRIAKRSVSGYRFKVKLSDQRALIGHTRHATQGTIKRNFNNHPFSGKAGKTEFALAHNGVIINDELLRECLNLPDTVIETDSYIAVQLIERKRKLNFKTLAYMAESLQGSFSFSVLDTNNNVYLVKGDSPICVLHFPKKGIYIYASTESILWRALINTDFFTDLKNHDYENIIICGGEIVRLCANGRIERGSFIYDDFCGYGCDWRSMGISDRQLYVDDLKAVAREFGYEPEDIDRLLNEGMTLDEIEEYFYMEV